MVRFLQVAKRGVVAFQCYDSQMVQGGCGVTVLLLSGIRHRVDHYGFVLFVVGCAFDFARAYLAHCRSTEVD